MGSKVQIFFTSSQAQGLLLYKIDLKAQIFSTSRNELKVSNTHNSSYKEIKVHNLYLCMVSFPNKSLYVHKIVGIVLKDKLIQKAS
jgi:hypothetical protein